MKKLICIFLAICLPISLVSCAEGESAQLRTGQRLMKGYLSDRDENAVLTESHADVLRPAADQLVLSDYVKGTFRDGGASYEITVNVVTGEIYTSERLPEFAESCIRLIEERLGLNPGDCVGNCSVMEPCLAKGEPRMAVGAGLSGACTASGVTGYGCLCRAGPLERGRPARHVSCLPGHGHWAGTLDGSRYCGLGQHGSYASGADRPRRCFAVAGGADRGLSEQLCR